MYVHYDVSPLIPFFLSSVYLHLLFLVIHVCPCECLSIHESDKLLINLKCDRRVYSFFSRKFELDHPNKNNLFHLLSKIIQYIDWNISIYKFPQVHSYPFKFQSTFIVIDNHSHTYIFRITWNQGQMMYLSCLQIL